MLLTFLLACAGGAPAEIKAPEAISLSASDVAQVRTEPISEGPRLSGTLEAASRAIIRAEASGSVESVRAEIGQVVEKGEVLATIESTALRQASASAAAGLAAAELAAGNARREQERVLQLKEAGALSERDVEQANAALKSAEANLEAARANQAASRQQLSGATVKAPMAGVISSADVHAGDVVGLGGAMFTIIDPSSLRLEGAMPADNAGAVVAGASAFFTVQGMGARRFEGRVERVSPAVDPTTRQIPLIVSVPNEDGALLAGLFAEGRVAVGLHDGLVVPVDAISGQSALRVTDGHVEKVQIELGLRDDMSERVEIKSGLAEGDTVLVGGARDIAPGAAVTVRAGAEG